MLCFRRTGMMRPTTGPIRRDKQAGIASSGIVYNRGKILLAERIICSITRPSQAETT